MFQLRHPNLLPWRRDRMTVQTQEFQLADALRTVAVNGSYTAHRLNGTIEVDSTTECGVLLALPLSTNL